MQPPNGTTLEERQVPTLTLPAAVLASILFTSTGHQTALPLSLNGTNIACAVGPISGLVHNAMVASSLSAMLTDIRSNFQLNASELAQILGVSRPTLYAWSSEATSPRAANVRRLQILRDASISWREMIGDHTDSVAQRFGDKPQLLDILRAAEAEGAINRLQDLATARHGTQRVESTAERLRNLGFGTQSPAELSRALEDHGW